MKWQIFLVLLLLTSNLAAAVDFNSTISADDKAKFDQILQPVMKIYNFVKYAATTIAVLVLLFAGLNYITSGSNPRTREDAKNMGMYVVIGLIVIWVAPLIVSLIVG